MKTILLFISLFFLFPETSRYIPAQTSANIVVTEKNIIVETRLSHKTDSWGIKNKNILNPGVNKFYYVLNENQSVKIEIVNY